MAMASTDAMANMVMARDTVTVMDMGMGRRSKVYMKILYIGTPDTYRLYKEGKNPSHWLYGAVEMQKDGHQVIWEKETSALLNDYKLVRKYNPDLVFIPNLNIRNHAFLLFLRRIGTYRKPIIAFLHHTPKSGKIGFIYSFLLKALKHCFFLSSKTMEETISGGYLPKCKCNVPGWGPDMEFYSKYRTNEDNGYFISTGKENRDFDLLIEVFKETKQPLKIITCKSHAGNNHEDLVEKCKDIPNIEVIITENSGNVYPYMVSEMSKAKALVCPLRQDKLNYCVGLSTIVDAEGLEKPLIISKNPYHDNNKFNRSYICTCKKDWIKNTTNLLLYKNVCNCSITECYTNMKEYIE